MVTSLLESKEFIAETPDMESLLRPIPRTPSIAALATIALTIGVPMSLVGGFVATANPIDGLAALPVTAGLVYVWLRGCLLPR